MRLYEQATGDNARTHPWNAQWKRCVHAQQRTGLPAS